MKDRAIFDEVNEKIGRLKQKFSIKIDWEDNNSSENDSNITIVEAYTDNWQDASQFAKGAKLKAIEEVIPNSPSSSLLFYAPKGAIIDSHSHPQMEFCICLAGKIKFITKNDEIHILEPIESIYIQPNDLHLIEFIKDSQLIVTWFPKLIL